MSNPTSTPAIAAAAVEFPPHRYTQDEVVAAVADFAGPEFLRFAATSGVQARQLALPLERYSTLGGFTEANAAFVDVGTELGERAIRSALDKAGLRPSDVDIIFSSTVTGVAVPTLDARLANKIGLRPDLKRVPLFGLGCVAGAAGVARMYDYLCAYPDQVAVLIAVELCSLTMQRHDRSTANLVAASLFGDGAAAVVAVGGNRAAAGPRVIGSRSRLYPDSADVMGWNIGSDGFSIILSADVPDVAEKYLGEDVGLFLDEFGLATSDIGIWVCHPGGPKVIEAIENVLELPADALDRTRKSLRENGNLSSVSVLDVLAANLAEPPADGELGLMIAMGPGFCSELVLLKW